MKVTTIWVDAALRLDDKDLRVMKRIVQSQNRLTQGPAGAAAAIPRAVEMQAAMAR
jgi:hypothetical protein